MPSSTVLRRTPAGEAELATPARGLSIGQRRILSLLDTPGTSADLASRGADAGRLDRDVARLLQAGLVVGIGRAPLPTAAAASNDALGAPVRLGAPRLWRRLPLAILPIAAGTLAWIAWQHLAPPTPGRAHAGVTAPVAAGTVSVAPRPADPVPIATRVLRSDNPERLRDVPKEVRQPKSTEPISAETSSAAAEPPRAAPAPKIVEHPSARNNASEDGAHADARSVGSAAMAPSRADPPASESRPIDAPKPLADAVVKENPSALRPEAPPPETLTPPPSAPTTPVSAAPASSEKAVDAPVAAVQIAAVAARTAEPPATAHKLVPISREEPAFPRDAIMLHLASGTVTARLTLDAQGRVSAVDIVTASHRSFDRAVRDALARWQFAPGAAGRTTIVDVAFKRD